MRKDSTEPLDIWVQLLCKQTCCGEHVYKQFPGKPAVEVSAEGICCWSYVKLEHVVWAP